MGPGGREGMGVGSTDQRWNRIHVHKHLCVIYRNSWWEKGTCGWFASINDSGVSVGHWVQWKEIFAHIIRDSNFVATMVVFYLFTVKKNTLKKYKHCKRFCDSFQTCYIQGRSNVLLFQRTFPLAQYTLFERCRQLFTSICLSQDFLSWLKCNSGCIEIFPTIIPNHHVYL